MKNENETSGIDANSIGKEMREAYEDLNKAVRLHKRGIRLLIAGGCMMAAGVVGLILMNHQEDQ